MKIGLVGCGAMCEAIVKGWLNAAVEKEDLIVIQRSQERTEYLINTYQLKVDNDFAALGDAEVVLIGVKPQDIKAVLNNVGKVVKPGALVISIAVGVTTEFIQRELGTQNPVVRAMPNTPALVQRGVTGLAGAKTCTQEDLALAKKLLSVVGTCLIVDEDLIDVVAATSGSGPAYFFWLVENLTNAAERLGLTKEAAEAIVKETFVGSALLLDHTRDSAETLRAKVTSPKGTTNAAITVLDEQRVAETFFMALQAAIARAHELREG